MADCRLRPLHAGIYPLLDRTRLGNELSQGERKKLRALLGRFFETRCPQNGQHCFSGECPFADRPDWVGALGYEDFYDLVDSLTGFEEDDDYALVPRQKVKESEPETSTPPLGANGRSYGNPASSIAVLLVCGIGALASAGALAYTADGFEGWLMCGVFVAVGILTLSQGIGARRDSEPYLVISERGVLTREFKLIPWQEILVARYWGSRSPSETRMELTLDSPRFFAERGLRRPEDSWVRRRPTWVTVEVKMGMSDGDDAAKVINGRAHREG